MPDIEKERTQFEHFMKMTGCVFDSPIYRDKPDVFAIKGGHKYGIELTEGCPEEFHRARIISRQNGMNSFCSSALEDNSKDTKRNNSELLKAISDADFVRTELSAVSWANRIAQRIKRKAELLKSGEIERFDQNWLVVIDAASSFGGLEHEFYRVALMAALDAPHLKTPEFDITYVVCLRDIFIIDKGRVIGARKE